MLAGTLALHGGSIRSAASGAAAALAHAGLPHDAAHKVDWRRLTDSSAPPDTAQGDTTPPDTVPPRLVRGEIDGATMRLVFSEALDEDATGGAFWVTVQTAKTGSRPFYATGDVTIDGALVTVGLGAGNPRAQAGLMERNHVHYLRRADTVGALRDLAGNPVSTPHWLLVGGGWQSSKSIDLVNVTGAAPVVTAPVATGVKATSVEVTSEPGADATYALGETVEVTVRFSEAVAVTGAPGLAIDMDPASWGRKQAVYARGSGTAALVFAHEVVEPNLSTLGIAVLADTLALNGGSIRSASSGVEANLMHVGLPHDAAHKVDWQRAVELPPLTARFVDVPASHGGEDSAFSFGLVFSEALVRQLSSATLRNVALRATNAAVIRTKRVVKRDNRRWTVTVRPDSGAEVTVSLPATTDCAAAGALCTPDGRPLSNAVTATISNVATVSQAAPAVTGVEVTSEPRADATYALGETVRVAVTFGEAVNVTGTPRLKLGLGSGAERWADYESGSGTAALAFAWTVAQGDASGAGVAVLANTLALNGGAIRSRVSGKDAALAHAGLPHDTNHKVDGTLPDTTPPRLSRTVVDGATMRLAFNEAIDNAASLTNGAFTVKRTPSGGTEETVGLRGSPAVDGAAVTLTLAQAVRGADTGVKVSYRKPPSDTRNRLRDEAGNEVADFSDEPVANSADTTPPELVRGEIDGGTMTLTFSETLDEDATGGFFYVHLHYPNCDHPFMTCGISTRATGTVQISGRTVTVGLGSLWETPNRATAGAGNYVRYYKPTSPDLLHNPTPGVEGLRDLAGNEVSDTRLVTLDNLTAPSVTGEAVSSDAGDDDTYAQGETIRVGLTFNAAVEVTGAPRVKLDLSSEAGDEKWADYESGSGTKMLEFAWTVAQGDESSAGVAVLKDTLALNGGTIRLLGKQVDANLSHAALGHDPSHKVDGIAPTLSAATVDGSTLTLTFSETLGAAASLANSVFTVKKTPQGGVQETVSLSGSPAISGATVSLTLASAVLSADTGVIKVSYTKPASEAGSRLRDETGNEVVSFTDQLVTNGTSKPAVTEVEVTSDAGADDTYTLGETVRVTVTFSEEVAVTDTPRVQIDFSSGTGDEKWAAYTSGSGTKMLEFAYEVVANDLSTDGVAVLANTLALNGGTIESASVAGESAKLAHAALDHDPAHRVDARPPTLSAATMDGATLILTFDEALGAAASLANGAFTVKKTPQGGTEEAVSLSGTPAIGGATVTLTLANAVLETDTDVKVSYAKPTSGTGNRLRDRAGNEVVSFTDQAVSTDTTPPRLVRGEVDGGTMILYFSEALDEDSAGGFFRVNLRVDKISTVEFFPRPLGEMEISGNTVVVDLGRKKPIRKGVPDDYNWVRYLKFPDPTAMKLRDLAGNEVRTPDAFSGYRSTREVGLDNITGVARLSVADTEANEGTDAAAAFEVTLSSAATGTVTVNYATADGTAEAGADYTATSGTLTFAAGETAKTISVPVLDDAVDEGEETFTLRLSNAAGARITDGEAVGTIANDDPLQTMWLSRFGRTVASHVTDAVSDRLAAPPGGAQVTVAGQRVDLAQAEDGAALAQALTGLARALGASEQPAPWNGPGSGSPGSGPGQAWAGGWPGAGMGVRGSPALGSSTPRDLSGRALLRGSAFHLAGEGEGGGPGLAAWGRVVVGGFDGEAPADAGSMRIDGDVTTGVLGADAEWDRLLAGVAISVSEGEGSFDQPGVDSGAIESTMTVVSPYARFMVNDRLSVWGLAGWGTGDMTIVQAANDRGQAERVTRTDLEMRLGAVGGRGALLEADETGGIDLGLKADAFFVETEAEAVSNEGATTAVASRVRLALEGSRAFRMDGGGTLTPGVELGVRHDGGDAETGTGVELGGRVAYEDPETGLSVEARVRTLVAHEDADYREWGASGAVRLAPGERGRGLSFSLSPAWGAASSGMERLWSARDARGLAPGGEFDAGRRLEGELGYGLGLFGARFTGTPNLGFGLSDGAREVRLGWRLTSAVRGDPGFEVSLDATRREAASGDEPSEHGVMLRGAIRW